jgi:hypothetical protein
LGKRGKEGTLFAIPKKGKRVCFIAGTLEHWNIPIFYIKTTWNIDTRYLEHWNIATTNKITLFKNNRTFIIF